MFIYKRLSLYIHIYIYIYIYRCLYVPIYLSTIVGLLSTVVGLLGTLVGLLSSSRAPPRSPPLGLVALFERDCSCAREKSRRALLGAM